MWLAFSVRPLTIDEFAEAFVLDRENMASLQKDRLFNAEDALQYLPSLIIKMPPTRKVKGPTVRFSHFSVKEYITSERLLQGKNAARSLYFSETDAHIHIAHTCAAIIFPSKEQREKLPTPLRPYAQSNFNSHVDKILDHPLTSKSSSIAMEAFLPQELPGPSGMEAFLPQKLPSGMGRAMFAFQLQLDFIAYLLATGQSDKAEREIKRTREFLNKGFRGWQSMFDELLRYELKMCLGLGRYEEAVTLATKCIRHTEKMPWPAPPPPPDLEIEDPHPRFPLDPTRLPKNPSLWLLAADRSVALQAQSHAEARLGSGKRPTKLAAQAEADLSMVMRDMNNLLGDSEWQKDNSSAGGMENSNLYGAMIQEQCLVVEILASLGANNGQDGLHYVNAIAYSKKSGFARITALLEEHRALCATQPRPNLFPGRQDLESWITGRWTGSYLHRSGGPRKDLKKQAVLELRVVAGGGGGPSVDIEGSATNDTGEWLVEGTVLTFGEVILMFYLKNSLYEWSWEYHGCANLDRGAIGGFWGFRGGSRDTALGSFFFFRCSAPLGS
jgi:hypothetical protein